MLRRTYHWMESRLYSHYADAMLAILFFCEAIFFLPTDPMLIFYCMERRNKSFRYATIAMFASVLGGVTGYFIGYHLWLSVGDSIVHHSFFNTIASPERFAYLCKQYKEHQYVAILLAGFTPIPYKAATLTAGFCRLSLAPFIMCSLIARGARFYIYAFVIQRWGKSIKIKIEQYSTITLIITFLVIAVTGWWFYC